MDRRLALWLVPVLTTIHNLEEALLMPALLARRNSSVTGLLQKLIPQITYRQFLIALAITTITPYLIAAGGELRLKDGLAVYLLLIFQCLMLINVPGHGVMAVIMGGYAPGVVTALALNLPFSIYLLKRTGRERWASRRALRLAFVAGGLLHTPGLTLVILMAGAIDGRI
ncbi:MAG TPA: HXXEE domain-containing protein [Blastocatellia bacterium]|nr:HXXEE domain-containing protein [Blastocatellia bacterium]